MHNVVVASRASPSRREPSTRALAEIRVSVFISILTRAKPSARRARPAPSFQRARERASTRGATPTTRPRDARASLSSRARRAARIDVARATAATRRRSALGLCDIAIAANANARRAARERRTTREGAESDDKNALASFARAWGGNGRGRGMEDGDL